MASVVHVANNGAPVLAAVATSGSASDLVGGVLPDPQVPPSVARTTDITTATAPLLAKTANLADLPSPPTARTNLGLAPVAVSGSASDITTGTLADAQVPATITRDTEMAAATSGLMAKSANLSDVTSTATARANLQAVGTPVGNVVSFIGASAQWMRVNIINDPSAESGWADRLAFYFDADNNGVAETRTGYHNEYGEIRGRPAKRSTVAMRALGHADISTANIFEVMSPTQTDLYFGVGVSSVTCNNPLTLNSTLAATGNVTAPNIGKKVSTGTTAPSSPAVGDIWVDTN